MDKVQQWWRVWLTTEARDEKGERITMAIAVPADDMQAAINQCEAVLQHAFAWEPVTDYEITTVDKHS